MESFLQMIKSLVSGQRGPISYNLEEYYEGCKEFSADLLNTECSKFEIDIVPIRQNVMELIDNCEWSKLYDMLKKFPTDEIKSPQALRILFDHCITNKDTEMFRKIVSCKKFSDNLNIVSISIIKLKLDDEEFLRIILDILDFPQYDLEQLMDWILFSQNKKFPRSFFVKIFAEYGYHLTDSQLNNCVRSGDTELIRYLIQNEYDVQKSFNQCIFYDDKLRNSDKTGPFSGFSSIESDINSETIRLLIQNGIDISLQLDNLLLFGALKNMLDMVSLCVELKATKLNIAFEISCNNNCLDIINYLLGIVPDLSVTNNMNLDKANSETVVLLLKNEIHIDPQTLNRIFLDCFVTENDITKSLELMEYGVDPNCLFDQEICLQEITINPSNIIRTMMSGHSKSKLEFLVVSNKRSQLDYLANNYFSRLEPELNRLFIVALANGCTSMAIYLLDLGANYELCCTQALIASCFIGHMKSVRFLLDKGMKLNELEENLVMIVMQGHKTLYGTTNYYDKLITNNDTFRNDKFIFGKDHMIIFQLCIEQQVLFPGMSLLEVLPKEFYVESVFAYLILNNVDLNHLFTVHQYDLPSCLRQHHDNLAFFFSDANPIKDIQYTILELSVIHNKYDIVKILLENGAGTNNAMTYATKLGWSEIINLLQEYGATS
jgi:hypothetical protein